MYIHGQFINAEGQTISLAIVTRGDRTAEAEIGTDEAGLRFDGDSPVTISAEARSVTDHLLRHTATIRLLALRYSGHLFFQERCTDAVVNIWRGGECLFAGFIDPQAYSQPYNDVEDSVELNCIDVLAALSLVPYVATDSKAAYAAARTAAAIRPMADVLADVLGRLSTGLDLAAGRGVAVVHDLSRTDADATATPGTAGSGTFRGLAVSELLFMGDDETGVWSCADVVEEMVRFADMHIVQQGLTFYIYAWDTVAQGGQTPGTLRWYSLDGDATTRTSPRQTVISDDLAADTDTQLSLEQTYARLELTCRLKTLDKLVDSPLEADALTSPYSAPQKYVSELWCWGEGADALNGFYDITHDAAATSYDSAGQRDWYVWVKQHPRWTFPVFGDETLDHVALYCNGGLRPQQELPNMLRTHIGAAIMATGSQEDNYNTLNSRRRTPNVSLTDCLIVSVNGNESLANPKPDADWLRQSAPVAVYNGAVACCVLSPADAATTNYIVFSGKVQLTGNMPMTAPWAELNAKTPALQFRLAYGGKTVKDTAGDNRYYTRRQWKAPTPAATPHPDTDTPYGLILDNKGAACQLEYSTARADSVDKLPLLSCMLIVGSKCLVEKGTTGTPADFVWQDYKERSQCGSDAEYLAQSFTLGIDPKPGDWIIGTDFDLADNVDISMGIDASGTAIPIRSTDRLAGKLKFMVLGPYETQWDPILSTRQSPWQDIAVLTGISRPMAHVGSIVLKNFEVSVISDNAHVAGLDGDDLVYMTPGSQQPADVKDDLEFCLTSALTAADRALLGVAEVLSLSTVQSTATGLGTTALKDRITGDTAKAEQLYLDHCHRLLSTPHITLEQTLRDKADGAVSLFNTYRHQALDGKTFVPLAISRDLAEGTARLLLRESS